MQYIVLNSDKKPIEPLKNGGRPLEEVENFDNIGVLIPEPYIVLDFDTSSDAEIMLKIVREMGIKCLVMETSRGYHFWFKSPEPWKNFKKTRLAIGIYADCRSYGKLSYVVIKKDGVWRNWLQTFPSEEIAEVPSWLRPLATNKYEFKSMKNGDGRNQELFEYILLMQTKGYSKEEIRQTIKIINKYLFAEPLSEQELNTILREDAFLEEDRLKTCQAVFFDENGKFQHNAFAEVLIQDMRIITVNDQPFIYKDGYYQRADREIERRMVEMFPTIKKAQRAEVMDYIKIITSIRSDEIPVQEYIINLKNTRLDVRNEKMLPFDPNVIDFCRIPVNYDPHAYSAELDKVLNKVFKGDRQVIDLFEEMVGYLLIKNCRFRKGFLLYGSGSNGKSTILNLLKRFIGYDNISAIELEKLSDPFKTAELEHKLANIGDDINHKDIVDTGTLKKLFTGESVTVERKYQRPFILRNYAKMIFSCNEVPRILDKSFGMYSRLVLIPFTAVFLPDDEDFDPFIEDKITTEESLSYLLNMALRGVRRLLRNQQFTKAEVVEQALTQYQTTNSTVLSWIEEEAITKEELLTKNTDQLFSNFLDWCSRGNVKYPASIKTFHREIETTFNLERRRMREGDRYKWKFVVKL